MHKYRTGMCFFKYIGGDIYITEMNRKYKSMDPFPIEEQKFMRKIEKICDGKPLLVETYAVSPSKRSVPRVTGRLSAGWERGE